jgi:phosphoadenosine phosphosulfate reductase
MVQRLPPQLQDQTARVRAFLQNALERHARIIYASSLGSEAMVLTDIMAADLPQIEIFTIDTGRLPEATHELLARLEERYGPRIRLVHPQAAALSQLSAQHGVNGFRNSISARLACCEVRKVEPFKRAIAGFSAWVTGVRREQSQVRAGALPEEWDEHYGLYKLSPLLDWTEAQIWQYIRARNLPYNALHDQHYSSIGCTPCTRATRPGESQRAGRWWWEESAARECGLHPRVRPAASLAVTG